MESMLAPVALFGDPKPQADAQGIGARAPHVREQLNVAVVATPSPGDAGHCPRMRFYLAQPLGVWIGGDGRLTRVPPAAPTAVTNSSTTDVDADATTRPFGVAFGTPTDQATTVGNFGAPAPSVVAAGSARYNPTIVPDAAGAGMPTTARSAAATATAATAASQWRATPLRPPPPLQPPLPLPPPSAPQPLPPWAAPFAGPPPSPGSPFPGEAEGEDSCCPPAGASGIGEDRPLSAAPQWPPAAVPGLLPLRDSGRVASAALWLEWSNSVDAQPRNPPRDSQEVPPQGFDRTATAAAAAAAAASTAAAPDACGPCAPCVPQLRVAAQDAIVTSASVAGGGAPRPSMPYGVVPPGHVAVWPPPPPPPTPSQPEVLQPSPLPRGTPPAPPEPLSLQQSFAGLSSSVSLWASGEAEVWQDAFGMTSLTPSSAACSAAFRAGGGVSVGSSQVAPAAALSASLALAAPTAMVALRPLSMAPSPVPPPLRQQHQQIGDVAAGLRSWADGGAEVWDSAFGDCAEQFGGPTPSLLRTTLITTAVGHR